ncbi:MAG: SGNH/GDSL hydrolase family protein [Synechococcales bacterium]|nr:SGNH/GDSL hydrolase family protein [Synechococcales bacterium]
MVDKVQQDKRLGDRHFDHLRRTTARSIRFAVHSPHVYVLPAWCYVSLGVNAVLLALVLVLGWRDRPRPPSPSTRAIAGEVSPPEVQAMTSNAPLSLAESSASSQLASDDSPDLPPPALGPRLDLSYDEWVALLETEARAIANEAPDNLSILMGDSISLWFPSELLPPSQTWLNQGISGEGTAGLLKRLDLIDRTQPDTIFVMIGINDMLREVTDATILANQRAIIQELREQHPDAAIVVQSVLPHAGEESSWEGKERLLAIPNQRIRNLNRELAAIARQEGADFLDLYPLFSDADGNLRLDLTTDGLHLNRNGYLVWTSALQLFEQLALDQS